MGMGMGDGVGAAPAGGASAGEAIDYTRIPGELDKKFEAFDEDGALRPTIINPADVWSRTASKGLLAEPTTATMFTKEQKDEKNRAFDLLDALSKSGALPIEDASLHVVIAATHCFDKTLLDTVIQGNVNPIEKVERSVMIVATHTRRAPANPTPIAASSSRSRWPGTPAARTGSPTRGPGWWAPCRRW